MDSILNNLQSLICHKTQTNKQMLLLSQAKIRKIWKKEKDILRNILGNCSFFHFNGLFFLFFFFFVN